MILLHTLLSTNKNTKNFLALNSKETMSNVKFKNALLLFSIVQLQFERNVHIF